MGRLPEGTVTFLFSDIAGSTRLLQELGSAYAELLLEHRARLRDVWARHRGVEVDTAGDSFFIAFVSAADAAAAALGAQEALQDTRIRVRIGVHTGKPMLAGDGYVGIDVHRAARISGVAHGGQVVISETTRKLLAEGSPITDLGQHRLKDLVAPEHLFQLGGGNFPHLRSLSATNLPEQASPLIGRAREIAEVAALLEECRVVTLTGPGGIGKTRLAIQTAAEIVDRFPDGVWWVPLAAVEDPDLVLTTVADALGTEQSVAEHIHDKRVLAVLDNLEQVIDAAPHISNLVTRCPNLRVLVTSRAPLRISGEREYAVEPLPEDDAMALFQERAFDVARPDVVAEICRRVDRLPLAVELAAARTRLFSAEQLLVRLDRRLPMLEDGRRDAPPRHGALRRTIAWSFELLHPAAQNLFARLGVFVGSFDVDAAERVANATLGDLEVLVQSSLMQQAGDRISMLETIREYAVEQLDATVAPEETRNRHLEFFVDLAERGSRGLEGPDINRWLARFEIEQDNVRAALGWALEDAAAEQALRLCTAMSDVWLLSSRLDEGIQWSGRALALGEKALPKFRARALLEAGALLMLANREQECVAKLEEGIALCKAIGDDEGLAIGQLTLSSVVVKQDLSKALRMIEDSLAIHARNGFLRGEYRGRHLLGEIMRDAGELDVAAPLLERAIEIAEELGATMRVAATAHSLADLEFDRGNLDRAESLYRASLRNASVVGIPRHKAYCVAGLAAVAARRGLNRRAARLWSAVERDEAERGYRLFGPERVRYERPLAAVPAWHGEPVNLEAAVRLALGEEPEEADARGAGGTAPSRP